ncbi:erythritol kinase (L-erythritol 4-phosphate-forming) [Stella humosa]|uniref:Erythritol kinase (L-erythritol 4-phosphate-forming) n=1 Tax=Stella humosa TaxID=94 RepID=A0A3N1KKS2_9PROT|nr:FGGY-family carbohydrate kinase [Stella humosa]ROP81421.1 erythritol kinase (L-erythritol 4-phosphate-forming) [Stella humosa]BBK32773.1 carbohydrate kinase [Stella humosa]
MAEPILVGIDAGTSVIKSVAFALDGTPLAVTFVPNRWAVVPGGGAEQDMQATWLAAAETLRRMGEQVPDLARRLAGIAVTGQGDGTWLVDAGGEPVGPAMLWLDARAGRIVDAMRRQPADAIRFAATGTGLAACQQGPQLAWLRQHRPDAIASASTAFHCKDWLYLKLTGQRATDPSEGALSFGDFRTRAYSDAVVDALDMAPLRHLLPEIVDGTAGHATLTADAARAAGLLAGTPVVLGYIDIVCSALGAGLYDRDGAAGTSILGSTGMHMRLVRGAANVALPAERTGYTIAFPVDGTYAQMQSNLAATLNIDWMLDLIGGVLASAGVHRDRAQLLAGVDDMLAGTAPGTLLFHPYISEGGERGPFVDVDARAGFFGLSTRHGHADLVRAVFEGLALAARDCYAAMGPMPAEVRVSGGGARSQALRQMLAATLDAPVRASTRQEAGAAGAAMIAAVSLGLFTDMDACVARWVTPHLGTALAPDPELVAAYARIFPAYQEARRAMPPVWRRLAEGGGDA